MNLFALNRYYTVANFFHLVSSKEYIVMNTKTLINHAYTQGVTENSISSAFCSITNSKQDTMEVFTENMLSCEFVLVSLTKTMKKKYLLPIKKKVFFILSFFADPVVFIKFI